MQCPYLYQSKLKYVLPYIVCICVVYSLPLAAEKWARYFKWTGVNSEILYVKKNNLLKN